MDGVAFLQWSLPQLGLRWRGYRRVKKQVLKRVRRRMQALGLEDHDAYRAHLAAHPDEWPRLEAMSRVTISRFFRNHRVFEELDAWLVARGEPARIWSSGCASGEEPYSAAIICVMRDIDAEILGTDASAHMLDRAREAEYLQGSLREVPPEWRAEAFEDGRLKARFRERVRFIQQDLRREAPAGRFDVIFCRNMAFTYFDRDAQIAAARTLRERLVPDGKLILGAHERLPDAL